MVEGRRHISRLLLGTGLGVLAPAGSLVVAWGRGVRLARAFRSKRVLHPMSRLAGIGLWVLLALLLPASVLAQSGQVVEFYHLDALGSVRAVSNQEGQIVSRHEFLPFGEEWTPGTPQRENKLFTGKERDPETKFDYFGARYYDSQVGRFTTIDPVYTWKENLADPQRWNRYAYVRNNPLRYIDPDGRMPWDPQSHQQAAVTGAKANGLTEKDTKVLAEADKAVDKNEFFNDEAHFMPGYEAKSEARVKQKLDQAVMLEQAGKHEEAMKTLGEGLHTVQDKSAHQNAGWPTHIAVYLGGRDPDSPKQNPNEYRRAEQASKDYIKEFVGRIR